MGKSRNKKWYDNSEEYDPKKERVIYSEKDDKKKSRFDELEKET